MKTVETDLLGFYGSEFKASLKVPDDKYRKALELMEQFNNAFIALIVE